MYRTSADPNTTEIVYTQDVSTAAGKHSVGILAALSIICLVMLGVTLFAGAPREIQGKEWLMALGAAIFGVPAGLVYSRRARVLTIERHGESLYLRVDGTELSFPIRCGGTQVTHYVNGIPMYEVVLQLVDDKRRAIVLSETRGAIHGKQDPWFTNTIDGTVKSQAFEAKKLGGAIKLRSAVEKWNEEGEG
jgi:hypothetical protein